MVSSTALECITCRGCICDSCRGKDNGCDCYKRERDHSEIVPIGNKTVSAVVQDTVKGK